MALGFRSPIYQKVDKGTGNAVQTVAILNGLKFYSGLTAQIFQSIYSQTGRLDLTQVEGQTLAFMKCAPVSAIIGRLAEYSMNGRYGFIDQSGKEVNRVSSSLAEILSKPNLFQTWNEFIASAMTYLKLNGQCYIMPVVPVGFSPSKAKMLWVIPNWMVQPQYTGKAVYQTDITGVVSGYKVSFLKDMVKPEEMLVIRDTMPNVNIMGVNTIHEGQSRLFSMSDQVNNLIAIQDALYNLTVKRGALGAWVPENSKDGIGQLLPMKPTEKESVIEDLLQYGTQSSNLAPFNVLRFGMKWVQAAMSVNDLKLFEGNEAGIAQLSMAFNVPLYLLGFKDSTFTNLEAAGKACYSSGVIPAVDNICANLSNFFGLGNIRLKAFFDHLEIFQKSKKDEADALNSLTSALDKPFKAKVITMQEYRRLIAGFMPMGSQFDPETIEGDFFDGSPTQTVLTQG